MNIIWLINIPLPEVSMLMNETPSPFGGWLVNASNELAKHNINLSILFPKKGITSFDLLKGERINYYPFPIVNDNDKKLIEKNSNFETILEEVEPDVVHIFGTEYSHTLSMINICKSKGIRTVISIQGLVSVYAKHYMASLPSRVQRKSTFRDLLKQDNLIQQQNKFIQRGRLEIEALSKADHIIGRTTWDRACVKQINSKATYHFCNETLRESFYKNKWNINQCEKYTIFTSQGNYPIKGLHYFLEAMPIILKSFPDAKLYIAGNDIASTETLKDKLTVSSYSKYIKKLIKENNLEKHVEFTGLLDEKQMCEQYLKSNVFVCPSSVENSPNSLGEAMILGVPCVASYVGGIPDMLMDKEEGFLYPSDAPYMLAHYICEIFANENLARKFSENARARALKTHDPETNTKRLIEIYEDIIQK